jgi:hypothetical protein
MDVIVVGVEIRVGVRQYSSLRLTAPVWDLIGVGDGSPTFEYLLSVLLGLGLSHKSQNGVQRDGLKRVPFSAWYPGFSWRTL